MSLDWLTFKSNLGNLDIISVAYVDDEGTEIPIESEIEFQEALRFARLSGRNHLQIILTVDKLKTNEFISINENQNKIFSVNKLLEKNKVKMDLNNANSSENICQCPEWFSHYMKKFKKNLIGELKSTIHETVHNAVKKEMKSFKAKQEAVDLSCDDKNLSSSPVSKKKKKKRGADKDCGDQLLEQREVKLLKKMEKLHRSKFEKLESKLENLDNKTRMLLEERRKLLERKRSKLEKKSPSEARLKNLKAEKSALILGKDVKVKLPPGGKFLKAVCLMNNGVVPWTRPQLECFSIDGFVLEKTCLALPRLKPGSIFCVNLEGRVTESVGVYHFKCRVVDCSEELSPPMIFWAEVLVPTPESSPMTTSQVFSSIIQENGDEREASEEAVKELIDFEDDVISTSQKKIEENILEIEKRLQDIDLLRPSTSFDSKTFKTDSGKKSDEDFGLGFPTTGFDLLQSLGNVKSFQKDLIQREEDQPDFGELIKSYEEGQPQGDSDSEKAESLKKEGVDGELQSDSDSELSVIYVSEEEDNFIVVPLPSESPSSEPEIQDEEEAEKSEAKPLSASEAPQGIAAEEPATKDPKPEAETQSPEKKEEGNKTGSEDSFSSQANSTRSRRSPLGEESVEFKSKKIKSSRSTEYQFTAANLTQPSFCPRPENGGASTFTFTAETSKKQEEVPKRRRDVPRTDSAGRVIFAVNTNGYCLPVESLLEGEEPKRQQSPETGPRTPKSKDRKWARGERMSRHERHSDRFNEAPTVNILPNVLMNGASNMASLAISTAKSVINNLQSAFVTEGKTEMGKPAYENGKVSSEAMFLLYEMGFRNLQTNRRLLDIHDNDLAKVVEELVLLQCQRPSNEGK